MSAMYFRLIFAQKIFERDLESIRAQKWLLGYKENKIFFIQKST
jgi:hypothetical protein